MWVKGTVFLSSVDKTETGSHGCSYKVSSGEDSEIFISHLSYIFQGSLPTLLQAIEHS